MLSELGPSGFCLIAFSDSEIIGTISAKPFEESKAEPAVAPDGHPRLLFKRPPPVSREQEVMRQGAEDEDGERWELLASAVALRVKGMGVASVLADNCVEEIRRMVREGERNGEGEVNGERDEKVILYLSTLQELNEEYYQKRGWRSTGVRRFEAGTAGSRDGFGVVEMVKVV